MIRGGWEKPPSVTKQKSICRRLDKPPSEDCILFWRWHSSLSCAKKPGVSGFPCSPKKGKKRNKSLIPFLSCVSVFSFSFLLSNPKSPFSLAPYFIFILHIAALTTHSRVPWTQTSDQHHRSDFIDWLPLVMFIYFISFIYACFIVSLCSLNMVIV